MSGRERDWVAIRGYYEAGHTFRQCQNRFGFSDWEWQSAIGHGLLKPRSGNTAAAASRRRRQIAQLLGEGRSYREIADRLEISKSTVAYHARRLGREANDKCARRYDWAAVQAAIDDGLSRLECVERFGFSTYAWNEAARDGRIHPRDRRIPLTELLSNGRRTNRAHLKTRLFQAGLKQNFCEACGIEDWRAEPLSLALHHVNGDGADNRLENLQLLCPNCHSQTENFAGRNRRGRSRLRAA